MVSLKLQEDCLIFTSGSPNQGQLQIGIALVLEDRFSNQARESSKEIRRLHQEAKNITNANLNAVNRMATAGMAIGSAAAYGIGEAVLQGAKFIDTMTQTFVKIHGQRYGEFFIFAVLQYVYFFHENITQQRCSDPKKYTLLQKAQC